MSSRVSFSEVIVPRTRTEPSSVTTRGSRSSIEMRKAAAPSSRKSSVLGAALFSAASVRPACDVASSGAVRAGLATGPQEVEPAAGPAKAAPESIETGIASAMSKVAIACAKRFMGYFPKYSRSSAIATTRRSFGYARTRDTSARGNQAASSASWSGSFSTVMSPSTNSKR